MSIFTATTRFKKTAELFNSISVSNLETLLKLVLERVPFKIQQLFSEDEKIKIIALIGLTYADLQILLDGSVFIFERAAYENATSDMLFNSLSLMGLSEINSKLFADLWKAEKTQLISRLSSRMISGPQELVSFSWDSNMNLAQNISSKLKRSSVIFNFGICGAGHLEGNVGARRDNFAIGFSHERLFAFFSQIEIIQGQLDMLY